MIPQVYELSKGMTLSAVTTDRFKTACLTVSAAVEADAVYAPMNTLVLGVLGRGSANHPTLRALNRRMDMLYDLTLFSRNYRMGDMQILGSGAYFVDPAFLPSFEDRGRIEEENIRMLADSLYAPLYDGDGYFRADYTEREKTVQCDTIRDEKNQPAAYAEQRCRELTFSGDPHGISFYGTVGGVSAMTREALTERYRAVFPHAPLRFFYVGSSPAERVAELIDRTFRLPNGSPATDGGMNAVLPTRYAPSDCGVRRFEETLAVSQGKLVMLFYAGADLRSEDVFTAMVYNEIFGGSPLSKLFVNVREKKSLCYYCSSMFDFYKGYFSVSSGIRCENREAAELEILRQAEEIRRGHISASELECAKRYLISVYTSLFDSASSIENYFLARGIYGVSCTPEEAKAAIARVTRDGVSAYAQRVRLLSVYFLSGTLTGGNSGGGEELE